MEDMVWGNQEQQRQLKYIIEMCFVDGEKVYALFKEFFSKKRIGYQEQVEILGQFDLNTGGMMNFDDAEQLIHSIEGILQDLK